VSSCFVYIVHKEQLVTQYPPT